MSRKKHFLANNCYCSEPSVTPKNWKSGGKSLLQKDWRIQYYFYDPNQSDPAKQKKQVRIKGMNEYKTLVKRRAVTELILEEIQRDLFKLNYNPITDRYMNDFELGIDHSSYLMDALKYALEQKEASHKYKQDIKYTLKFVEVSVNSLGLGLLFLGDIQRKHIRAILKHQQQTRGISNHRYNKIKAMLGALFDVLIDEDIIENNPTYKIKKLQEVKKIRRVLQDHEIEKISEHLKPRYYTFWRFCEIFRYSGSRVSELLKVQVKDVDLNLMEFKVTVRKRNQPTQEKKAININVIHLWRELLSEVGSEKVLDRNFYIFSKGLTLGKSSIRNDQINKRFRLHVKKQLGIEADFYTYKHNYSDKIDALLGAEEAQRLNSHKGDRMLQKHYALSRGDRKLEKLKFADVSKVDRPVMKKVD